MTTTIEAQLDQLIAAIKANSIPIDHRWLDADGVGAMLSVGGRTVLERYAPRPDFPKPARVGHPRWLASEITAWMERQRRAA